MRKRENDLTKTRVLVPLTILYDIARGITTLTFKTLGYNTIHIQLSVHKSLYIQTHTHTHTHTHTQRERHTHRDTETQRHRDTETHIHTHTHTETHTGTQSQTQTHTHTNVTFLFEFAVCWSFNKPSLVINIYVHMYRRATGGGVAGSYIKRLSKCPYSKNPALPQKLPGCASDIYVYI